MTTTKGAQTVAARIQDVVDKAKAETGLDDFGGDSWREGLEVLVRSAVTEGMFNDFGEQSFSDSLVRPLVNAEEVEQIVWRAFALKREAEAVGIKRNERHAALHDALVRVTVHSGVSDVSFEWRE